MNIIAHFGCDPPGGLGGGAGAIGGSGGSSGQSITAGRQGQIGAPVSRLLAMRRHTTDEPRAPFWLKEGRAWPQMSCAAACAGCGVIQPSMAAWHGWHITTPGRSDRRPDNTTANVCTSTSAPAASAACTAYTEKILLCILPMPPIHVSAYSSWHMYTARSRGSQELS